MHNVTNNGVLCSVLASCVILQTAVMGMDTTMRFVPTHIQLPSDAPEPVRFAAEELRRFLSQVGAGEVPIRRGKPDHGAIVLSIKPASTGGDIHDVWRAQDTYRLVCDGSVLRIIGGSPRGVLFGAYDALARLLGARWFHPSPAGEVVNPNITPLGRLDVVETPAYACRSVAINYSRRTSLGESLRIVNWAARNRLNTIVLLTDRRSYWEKYGDWLTREVKERRGMLIEIGGHNSKFFLDLAGPTAEKHPDYHACLMGSRMTRQGAQVCLSNPAARKLVLDNVERFVRDNPQIDILHFNPQDGMHWCECEACVALGGNRPGEARGKKLPYNPADVWIPMLNEVIARIRPLRPDLPVKWLVYGGQINPPRNGTVPTAGAVPLFAPGYRSYEYPINSPASNDVTRGETNQYVYTRWQEWLEIIPGPAHLYEYYYKGAWEGIDAPLMPLIARDLRHLYSVGFRGVYTQASRDSWETYHLNLYTMARIAWRLDTDVDAMLGDYFTQYYGSVAEPMRRGMTAVMTALSRAKIPRRISRYSGQQTPKQFETAIRGIDEGVRQLEAALAQAKSVYRQRVAKDLADLLYTRATYRQFSMFAGTGEEGRRVKIDQTLFRKAAAVRAEDAKRAVALLESLPDDLFFGSEIHKQIVRDNALSAEANAVSATRDWIKPLKKKAKQSVAFITTSEISHEEAEALRWAEGQFRKVRRVVLGEQGVVRTDGAAASLDDFDCVWIHRFPEPVPKAWTTGRALATLEEFGQSGGGLFLTSMAMELVVPLGVEAKRPPTVSVHPFGYDRSLSFVQVKPDHAIFEKTRKRIKFRLVDRSEAWGECRWRVGEATSGEVLAHVHYPGSGIVEFALGRGRIIAAGGGYGGVFGDRTNSYTRNVERLTRRIVSYLATASR